MDCAFKFYEKSTPATIAKQFCSWICAGCCALQVSAAVTFHQKSKVSAAVTRVGYNGEAYGNIAVSIKVSAAVTMAGI